MNKFLGKSLYARFWIILWWNEYCCVHNCRWIHDYQDACVDKLEKFLRGEINTKHKRAALFQMGSSSEGLVEGGKYTSSGESSPSVDVSPNRDVSYSSWWLCGDPLPIWGHRYTASSPNIYSVHVACFYTNITNL